MKALSSSLLAISLLQLLSAEEQATQGQLVFPDGDSIPGLPAGVDAEGHLLWQSQLFTKDSVPFLTRKVDSILLDGPPVPAEQSTVATISFQTHTDKMFDVMKAELLGFDDKTVKLRTWYAGELTLKRSMLHSIEVSNESPAIINGPGRIEDWQPIESPDAWRIEGTNLISEARGSIARELNDLPDKVLLEFDLAYEYAPYLRLHFFADSGEELIPRTGYSISIQRGSMNFLKKVDNRSQPLQMNIFGQRHDFQEEDVTQVAIYIDRKKGSFSLYIDGNVISSAVDPEPLLENNWWHLSTLHGREQTLSNFAIRPWDGNLPERKDYLSYRQELPVEGEQVELQNGDTIVGKATAIESGKLAIETEYVPVAVPISRLSSFQITSPEEREEPRIYASDVRAYFRDGGHVTLRLSEFTPTTISGYSQVFGDATFDLRAFTHIEFNPYDLEFRERRGQPY
ncbi:hypothetical protein [Roseibacillus persicicus]|uniref:Uncharacterized protein n=1 Tax=Roseibacillus persicicus TaxID=454148 RepID=A0A918WJE0_9BACT|nr:hypothetical protein [Roseibacillus persicicus]GHC51871.1 hypothetical protein GCM10007100_17700 [Roseibacillus persicicus]